MWVKICGIRTLDNALAVQRCEPDAIGLNFHPGSKRYVELSIATEIGNRLQGSIELVGVFVNRPASEIRKICRDCRIETVQLHGDESPELAAELSDEFRVIRALRVSGETGLEPALRELAQYQRLGVPLHACLIDAHVSGVYGGTGHCAPWQLLATEWDRQRWPPMILAGGLRPDNVAAAIEMVSPWGVDVAGGVEDESGLKSPQLAQAFIDKARAAVPGPLDPHSTNH